MSIDAKVLRRSPRFQTDTKEDNFTTPPETPADMDAADNQASLPDAVPYNNQASLPDAVPNTCEDQISALNSTLIYTTASTNAHNLFALPSQQDEAIKRMQSRIQELEELLKSSLKVQPALLHTAEVKQPAVPASSCQNLTAQFEPDNSMRNTASTQYSSTLNNSHVFYPPQNSHLPFDTRHLPFAQGTNIANANMHQPFAQGINIANANMHQPFAQGINIANANMQPTASGIYNSRQYAIPRKLLDLPTFSGEPEMWPMFSVAYAQSTNEYGYTNFENCQRLQRSLKGKAFEVVKSLLIYPDNVSIVMDQLESQFGRPEQLVASQIRDIKDVQAISEAAVGKFVSFATKAKNLSAFLQSAGAKHHLCNPTLIEELVSKLPMSRKIEWAKYAAALKTYPTVIDFSTWINETANILATICDVKPEQSDIVKRKTVMCTNVVSHKGQSSCFICGGDHKIYKCEQFIAKTVNDRWVEVKRHRLCFACLGKGHSSRECARKRQCTYPECKKTHNKLLHEKDTQTSSPNNTNNNQPVLSCAAAVHANRLLFRVLPVKLYGPKSTVSTYALLDDGSSVSLIDKSLMTELGLIGKPSGLALQWINGRSSESASNVVDVFISGANANEKHLLKELHAIDKLNLTVQSFSRCDLDKLSPIISSLPIVEYRDASPRILIGLDNYHLGLASDTIQITSDGPFVTNTKLGWAVFGKTGQDGSQPTCLHIHTSEDASMDQIMSEFFSTENFGVRPAPAVESDDDIRARRILRETTKIMNGRFQSGLLWKKDDVILPDSLPMAMKRLTNIEKKMNRDDVFAAEYRKAINGYLEKDYARKLTAPELEQVSPYDWYLPHFAVVNPNKPRKLRLVFDAAAKVDGISLNTVLLKGPQEYQPLPSVIFKFRLGRVGVCADIKEMFHRIYVRPEDRCAQRFLWRDGCHDRPPAVYEMKVMTFGAACSPCAAHYVKVENAKRHTDHDPRAIEAIMQYHYVDDFVDSFESEEQAIKISTQVREIHSSAGFELRGFISNSKQVANVLNGSQNPTTLMNDEALSTEKVLGMFWFPKEDTFRFRLQFNRVDNDVLNARRVPTKRELLSIIMSVFDPLGCLSHLMIVAKLIMKEVWRSGTQWDDLISDNINSNWLQWKNNLDQVTKLEIPRHYFNADTPRNIEIHVFVDASESAFAAVCYWRYIDENNEVKVSFICSKSRCGPMKRLSVPRMELQAAVLGVRLMQTVSQEHHINVETCILWSDSSTVIKWIKSKNSRYKQFVAHRVNEILNVSDPENWRWVPTRHNPADEATRLRHNINMNSDSIWFTGPTFLKDDAKHWPKDLADCDEESHIEEELSGFVLSVTPSIFVDIGRFSSYMKLKRTMAWVLRFTKRCKEKCPAKTFLSLRELQEAEEILLRTAQEQSYAREIQLLERGAQLPKGSPLRSLVPYKDDKDILRVGGRLVNASWIPYEVKHPIIIHPDHNMTKLIVRWYHEKMAHQNHEATIAEIRQRFWIPGVRQVLKRVIGDCMRCRIDTAKPVAPMMGQLPVDRLTPYVRPFTYTGLDYFGPINVSIGRRQEKRWVALFTCLTVRAIPLEIAFDLSTDACILAIRNFINRRGTPLRMRSDNGKNFVGLNGDMKQFSEVFDCNSIQDELSARNVQWIFNCPLNPSEGGIWERMVRSVKRVLQQTMSSSAPREHTLLSFLIEAENIVNSRPLTHVPVSVHDDDPITPNHFLLGVPNTAQTPPADSIDTQQKVLRKQWRISRQLRDHFWKRWIMEYLPTLTRREKWCEPSQPLKVNDLVLICDINVARKDWLKGRVMSVTPGADGVIRRAEIRTCRGILNRPVSKLAILDVVLSESE